MKSRPIKCMKANHWSIQTRRTMSRSSQDYNSYSRGTTLPSIRDVMGDVLAQPARPRDSSSRNRSMTPGPSTHPTTSTPPAYFPPIRPLGETDSSRSAARMGPSSSRDHRMQSPSPPPAQTYRRHEFSPPPGTPSLHSASMKDYRMHSPSPRPVSRAVQREGFSSSGSNRQLHSYDVFVASDQGLVHKRSSTHDDFHQVTKEDVIANSTGKHICAECQRRFEKLSTLKNHLTTHSGERPHECPDCGKSFSVYTNMRRHQSIHKRSGTSD